MAVASRYSLGHTAADRMATGLAIVLPIEEIIRCFFSFCGALLAFFRPFGVFRLTRNSHLSGLQSLCLDDSSV